MEILSEGAAEKVLKLAVSAFNDGASSLSWEVAKKLGVTPTPFSTSFLSTKDKQRLRTSKKKASEETKAMRRKRRRIRKGLVGGVLYEAGAFGDNSGPIYIAREQKLCENVL